MANLNHNQTFKINQYLINNLFQLWDKFIGENLGIYTQEEDSDEIIHNIINSTSGLDIINQETGEIVATINFEDILEDRAELPSSFPFIAKLKLAKQSDADKFDSESEALIAEGKRLLHGIKKYIASLDEKIKKPNETYSMDHGFFAGKTNNHETEGVMNHRPEWEGLWHDSRNDLKVQAYDGEGRLTDRFYGEQNDFDEWFLARANRGEKMKITAQKDGKWVIISEIRHLYFGGRDFHFKADSNFNWRLA